MARTKQTFEERKALRQLPIGSCRVPDCRRGVGSDAIPFCWPHWRALPTLTQCRLTELKDKPADIEPLLPAAIEQINNRQR
jgi:hypothetical protein